DSHSVGRAPPGLVSPRWRGRGRGHAGRTGARNDLRSERALGSARDPGVRRGVPAGGSVRAVHELVDGRTHHRRTRRERAQGVPGRAGLREPGGLPLAPRRGRPAADALTFGTRDRRGGRARRARPPYSATTATISISGERIVPGTTSNPAFLYDLTAARFVASTESQTRR